MLPEQQIEKLANFIMAKVPGEPSQSEGAVDCAIRIIKSSQCGEPAAASQRKVSEAERSAIFQALGEASLCWTPAPNDPTTGVPVGIFNSTAAEGIGNRLVATLEGREADKAT